ncbi:flagellar hook protein FlgE [Sporomusa sp.]|uniref:flagellar hook protein FlgE n=1 Tax=Sporomusa sp. TaxID=2078658 RepID=UPI002BC5871E|nr:flagellar hook protein FlgE [Sporomusa sp.]HWR43161.1 flagellar hook protein FlgE [Sporomusa sp.]
MIRSLFAGVSGLKNHQTRMDVIGNNIANVNTVGFKSGRVTFQDMLSQTIQGSAAATGNKGGTNPMQIGLGMGLASIDTIFTDGSPQPTGKQTDLSISGQGLFVLSDGQNQVFTRAGAFDFDTEGNYLVPGTGYKVMGWKADANGKIDSKQDPSGIKIPVGSAMAAQKSSKVPYINNLSAGAKISLAAANALVTTTAAAKAAALAALTPTAKAAVDATAALVTGDAALITTYNNAKGALTATAKASVDAKAALAANPTDPVFIAADAAATAALVAGDAALITTYDTALAALTTTAKASVDATAALVAGDAALITTYNTATADAAAAVTAAATNDNSSSVPTSITVYDSQGNPYNLKGTFEKSAANTWTFTPVGTVVDSAGVTVANVTTTPSTLKFKDDGSYDPAMSTISSITINPAGGPYSGAGSFTVNPDFSTMTQYGGESTAKADVQDGYASGTLDKVTIDPTGVIVGRFSNGQSQNLAQVALAVFNNPAGLNKVGESMFVKSNNSGEPSIGSSDTGGRGKFTPGSLEMSNVDLAQEFSNMIITQRGFQANSKIITVSDEILQELANLKR